MSKLNSAAAAAAVRSEFEPDNDPLYCPPFPILSPGVNGIRTRARTAATHSPRFRSRASRFHAAVLASQQHSTPPRAWRELDRCYRLTAIRRQGTRSSRETQGRKRGQEAFSAALLCGDSITKRWRPHLTW